MAMENLFLKRYSPGRKNTWERIPRSLSKRKQRSRLYGAEGLAREYKKASFFTVGSRPKAGLRLAAGSFNNKRDFCLIFNNN